MESMSWSDDMRCLYCDGKLPLYRKITHGQFCSTNHRKAYWQEQERLAVERLHQTHSSLKAMRPAAPVESILGPSVPFETGLSGFVAAPKIYPQAQGAPWMLAADPLTYDMDLNPGRPAWSTSEPPVRSLRDAGRIRLFPVWFASLRQVPAEEIKLRGGDFEPRAVSLAPVTLLRETPAETELEVPPVAPLLPGRIMRGVLAAAPPAAALTPCQALHARLGQPWQHLDLPLQPATPELEAAPEPDAPPADRLFALAKFDAREHAGRGPQTPMEPIELPLAVVAQSEAGHVKPASFGSVAGRVPFAPFQPLAPANISVQPRVADSPARLVPVQPSLALPQRQPRLGMGRGSRYPVQYRRSSTPAEQAGPVDFPVLPADVALPAVPPAATVAPEALLDAIVPEPAGMVRLKVQLSTGVSRPIQPLLLDIATIPQPLRTEHLILPSRLEPLDAKPVSDEFQTSGGDAGSGFSSVAARAHLWTRAAGLWKLAPRDLKMLAFAIPALLALAFHRQLPKVHVAAPAVSTTQLRQSLHSVVNTQLASVRHAVVDRAGIALDDDFRSGLDDWSSRGDATAGWSFDPTGFVRPGPLALYRPSMTLSDYQFQFLGMIDKKAMSWVVRAADFDNYYVVKLEVLKPGPITTVGLTRYAVINGKAEDRVDTPVPLEAQPDTLYRVGMDLEGENFTLMIQGQLIDSWSEPRLMRGGLGFFTSHGEDSRVRWVAVRHQYDMLGRLCAYLAPYESPTTNGSW